VSYNRFVELLPGALVPLCCFLVSRFGRCSEISFIDSTQISVCHNRRIWSHKVMAEFAARGKTSVDWFYGFKLHRVINDQGELLGVKITAGNVDDRDPVPELARVLFGNGNYFPQYAREYFTGLAGERSCRSELVERRASCAGRDHLRRPSIRSGRVALALAKPQEHAKLVGVDQLLLRAL
jgi:Transposase DDE domain